MGSPDTQLPEQHENAAAESLPRLLVVDDQPANIQILFEIFHRDCEVFIATSGIQALEMCSSCLPDLILLDIIMPGMNGLEVCRRLKSDPATKDITILFVTAQENPEDEAVALEAGAVDFITKPVNPAVVRARVRTHLTLKSQADLLRAANEEMNVKNHDLQVTQNALSEKVTELEAILKKVQQLEGIIPICMHCKKIRSDKDYWQQVEQFLSDHSQARFSHGICPECVKEHYGDLVLREKLSKAGE